MDYWRHYARLIDRARGRVLVGYTERHHIRPRCMGGDNSPENLADLTPEEHYVAHQLLVKMYPGERGLATAAVRMAKQCSGCKAYGWLRRAHAEAVSARCLGVPKSPEHRTKIGAANAVAKRGSRLTSEHRAKISAAQRGRKRGPRSEATRIKLSMNLKAVRHLRVYGPLSEAHRAKISSAHRARRAHKTETLQ